MRLWLKRTKAVTLIALKFRYDVVEVEAHGCGFNIDQMNVHTVCIRVYDTDLVAR